MKPHLKYLSYVARHKYFVFIAGITTRAPLWRLVIHDWSKFLPCEWMPYVRNFYGAYDPEVGATVSINSHEGFGGDAVVTEKRNTFECKTRVQMLDDKQEFWAFRHEIQKPKAWKEQFDRAWLHHQHSNPHHWQHWILREDSGSVKLMEMPEHFAREMVADWMGAGRAITGKWEADIWYLKNKSVIQLAPNTRAIVEELLLAAPSSEKQSPPKEEETFLETGKQ